MYETKNLKLKMTSNTFRKEKAHKTNDFVLEKYCDSFISILGSIADIKVVKKHYRQYLQSEILTHVMKFF